MGSLCDGLHTMRLHEGLDLNKTPDCKSFDGKHSDQAGSEN